MNATDVHLGLVAVWLTEWDATVDMEKLWDIAAANGDMPDRQAAIAAYWQAQRERRDA